MDIGFLGRIPNKKEKGTIQKISNNVNINESSRQGYHSPSKASRCNVTSWHTWRPWSLEREKPKQRQGPYPEQRCQKRFEYFTVWYFQTCFFFFFFFFFSKQLWSMIVWYFAFLFLGDISRFGSCLIWAVAAGCCKEGTKEYHGNIEQRWRQRVKKEKSLGLWASTRVQSCAKDVALKQIGSGQILRPAVWPYKDNQVWFLESKAK